MTSPVFSVAGTIHLIRFVDYPSDRVATVRLALIFVLLALFAFAQPCRGESADTGTGQIRAALTAWKDQFNARDSRDACDLFAPDLVAVFRGQPVRNLSQVCGLLRRSLDDRSRRYHYDLDIIDVFASGDLGAVRLVWTLTVTRNDGALIDTSIEPGIDIFQRQPDRKWRIARYISFAQAPTRP